MLWPNFQTLVSRLSKLRPPPPVLGQGTTARVGLLLHLHRLWHLRGGLLVKLTNKLPLRLTKRPPPWTSMSFLPPQLHRLLHSPRLRARPRLRLPIHPQLRSHRLPPPHLLFSPLSREKRMLRRRRARVRVINGPARARVRLVLRLVRALL